MYLKKSLQAITLLFCLLWQTNFLTGQSSDYIEKVKIAANSMTFEFTEYYENFTVEIAGPDNLYLKEEIKNVHDFRINHLGVAEKLFEDGRYKVQLTPNFEQSKAAQKVLRYLTEIDATEKLKAQKELLNIPLDVATYTRTFTIKDGLFVLPRKENGSLKIPAENNNPVASLSTLKLATNTPKATFTSLSINERPAIPTAEHLGLNPRPIFVDQIIADDLIVQGSACVGLDCNNGESFSFDTHRLKENNLRIHFDDTSNSASFAANDWRIIANETTNGGAQYLAFGDATAGTIPFKVEAGAGNNALHVDNSGGNVGMGTATPVVELHMKDGDTPTLRLEQDGANGWTPQTWDVAGNETNFFIRDVTNSSNLVMRFFNGAPNNSIVVAKSGNTGFGLDKPKKTIHILDRGPTIRLDRVDDSGLRSTWDLQVDATTGVFSIRDSSNATVKLPFILHPGANEESFVVESDGTVTIGNFGAPSDIRVKKDIEPIKNALSIIDQLQPKNYHYRSDEFARFKGMNKLQYGLIAQDVETVVGDLINQSSEIKRNDGEAFDLKSVNYIGFIAILIKGMQEQQALINQQQTTIDAQQAALDNLAQKLNEVDQLKAQVAALAKLLDVPTVDSDKTAVGEKE